MKNRKQIFATGLLLALLAVPAVRAGQLLQPGDVVAVCGDSITEQKQYSVMIESYLLMCQPAPGLRVHQFGWSGEKADGFLNRMKDGVLPFKPAVATTFYGMNDGAYAPVDEGRREAYRKNMTAAVRTFKEGGVREVVVGSPGVVDSFTFDRHANKQTPAVEYNKTLSDLATIARAVSEEQGVAFADVNAVMAEAMVSAKAKHGEAYHVAGGDGIHPARNGHLVIAYSFLKAMGCSGEIGTITYDAAQDQAAASEGHKVVGCRGGSIEIESSRYPFCFDGAAGDPNGTRGMLEFIPFQEELNRFRLVVLHPPAAGMKITWGGESKTFSSAALQAGINLAAEFGDHPLVAPFRAVEAAVRKQQEFETVAVKTILPGMVAWAKWIPAGQSSFDNIRQLAFEKIDELETAARAQVAPVRHVILCEPAAGTDAAAAR